MADNDTISKLLELYQKCKMNGESVTLFLETKRGKDTTVTFTINPPEAGSSPATPPIRRRKSPSQLRRDTERRKKFFAKKLENPTNGNTKETEEIVEEKVLLVEPVDEIINEKDNICEKVFVFPKKVINNHNIGIEYDVTSKLEAKGLKVKKVIVERLGNPIRGEYIRSEAFIEPVNIKKIENENFEIENCWVLPLS